MSADNWRQEYHLTPNGWIKGTDRSYGHVQGDPVERPIDAVETWEEHITQSSIYSETFSHKKLLWTSPAHSQEVRDAIKAGFREPFVGGSPPPLDAFRRSSRRPAKARQPADETPSLPGLEDENSN